MKIVKIALCDDDADVLSIIAETTKTAFGLRGLKAETKTFVSPALFLDSLKTNSYDILMLEIDMFGMDGIALCKQLVQSGTHPEFIFVSDDEHRVFDTFAVHPFSFVRKNKFLKDITKTVNLYVEQRGDKLKKSIIVQTRDSKKNIKLSEIMYIEGSKNYQKLVLKNDVALLELRNTMDNLAAELEGYGFSRIHKGYIVNLHHIINVTKETVTLANGTQLPVSSRRSAELSEEYLAYCREKGSVIL